MNLSNIITKKSVFLTAVLGVGLALLIQFLYKQSVLSRSVFKSVAEPLFVIALSLLFVSFFLFLVREGVFRAWLRFAYWWIPVSLVFIYLAGGWSGGGFGIPAVLDQEFVSLILSGLFVLISLLLIAYKYFASRRSE